MSEINAAYAVRRYAKHLAVHKALLEDDLALGAVIGHATRQLLEEARVAGYTVIGEVSYQLAGPQFDEPWFVSRPWWHRLIPRRWRPPARYAEPPHHLLIEVPIVEGPLDA